MLGLELGSLYPLMMTGLLIAGSCPPGSIVNGPVPGMLNSIVSGNGPVSEFTWSIAQRSVPVLPSSTVLVTVKLESNCRSSEWW